MIGTGGRGASPDTLAEGLMVANSFCFFTFPFGARSL